MRQNYIIPRPLLVSFSGIDGAGKSTQIAGLCARLRDAGFQTEIIAFWNDVARLRRVRVGAGFWLFKGDRGVGSPEAPVQRRDKNVRSPLMTAIRLGIYLLDALSLRRIERRSRHSAARVVIFDRYLYDELANLSLRNPVTRTCVHGIMRLAPRPDISFLLDADPGAARARKPEYPVAFLCLCRDSYLRLSDALGGFTVIPSSPIQEVAEQVAACVLPRIFPRSLGAAA